MSGGASHMAMGTGGSHITMGGMSMSVAHGATNILPSWLSVIWTLIFLTVLVVHVRHVTETRGERQIWHCGHVLMAVGMLFMFAPPSLDHFGIPSGFWQLLFASAAGALVLWMLVEVTNGAAVNRLWLAIAFDLAAMAYMWSPNGFVPVITWILVAYFAVQALLWASDRYRELDGQGVGGNLFVGLDGTVTASSITTLVCERDLRVSMSAMAVGMAYMFAAMQIVR